MSIHGFISLEYLYKGYKMDLERVSKNGKCLIFDSFRISLSVISYLRNCLLGIDKVSVFCTIFGLGLPLDNLLNIAVYDSCCVDLLSIFYFLVSV